MEDPGSPEDHNVVLHPAWNSFGQHELPEFYEGDCQCEISSYKLVLNRENSPLALEMYTDFLGTL